MMSGLQEGLFYIRGTHTDKVDLASELALNMVVIVCLVRAARPLVRLLLLGLLGLNLGLVAFSFSTTGILGSALGLIVAVLLAFRALKAAVYLPIILLIAYFSLPQLADQGLGEAHLEAYLLKYQRQVEQSELYNFRLLAARQCIEGFAESPFVGHGFGTSPYIIQQSLGLEKATDPHSILSVALETGLVGLVPLMLFLLIVYWRAAQAALSAPTSNRTEFQPMIALAYCISLIPLFLGYFHWLNSTNFYIGFALVATCRMKSVMREAPWARTQPF